MPEPDPRFTLANERTFLAWLRTALALVAAGVALPQFAPDLEPAWALTALSLGCLLLSVVASLGGALRWRAVDTAMRAGAALPRSRLPWPLTAGLVVLALLSAALLLAG